MITSAPSLFRLWEVKCYEDSEPCKLMRLTPLLGTFRRATTTEALLPNLDA
jgi:hypothetical protein